jgi:gluconokinase
MIVVLMGISGAGKTTVGQALAQALGWPFLEGDAFHPLANRERMRSGVALTDVDRIPWLQAIGEALADLDRRGQSAVLACSALRQHYRDRLRAHGVALRFVLLAANESLLAERLARRSGHYMPSSLLPSQLALLEAPDATEQAFVVDATHEPGRVVEQVIASLGLHVGPNGPGAACDPPAGG